ncbi:MAG: hypothetical protein ACO3JJ_01665 [Opitutaceae bacterium]
MKHFDLAPDRLRSPDGSLPPVPTAARSVLWAALGFAVVSLAAYSVWAFRLVAGTGLLYASIAAVYLGASGWMLARLVPPAGRARYLGLFALGFLGYAVLWCLCWFGLRGRYHADFYGSVGGLAWLTWLHWRAFAARGSWAPTALVLLALHTLGYTAGDDFHALVGGVRGRLLWGLGHGLGFGAGLGWLLHRVQSAARSAD